MKANDRLPILRFDIYFNINKQDGCVAVQDSREICDPTLCIPGEIASFLRFFSGEHCFEDLLHAIEKTDTSIDAESQAMELISYLESKYLLEGNGLKERIQQIDSKYEKSSQWKARFAGKAYPATKMEIEEYLPVLASNVKSLTKQSDVFLYAPHIDFRVNTEIYASTFSSLYQQSFDHVWLIGTSHYAGYHPEIYESNPFIVVNKDFESPLGTVKANNKVAEALKLLEEDAQYGLSFCDRANRLEHSLEFHLLLAQHYLKEGFTATSILVSGLDELFYSSKSHHASVLKSFGSKLREIISQTKGRQLFLISGDLSHYGPRFGIKQDAQHALEEIEQIDQAFLKGLKEMNVDAVIRSVREHHNHTQICGLWPAVLGVSITANKEHTTALEQYANWYEPDDQSLVSFGSVLNALPY